MDQRNFETIYSAWPERAMIFDQGKVALMTFAEVDGYDNWHIDAEKWIRAKFSN